MFAPNTRMPLPRHGDRPAPSKQSGHGPYYELYETLTRGGAAACGDDEKDSGATTPAVDGGTEIDVTLQESSVIPEAESADAGKITFNVENIGPDDVHEIVIVKTEL